MHIIVTHSSPDMDAITSVWLIKKFLPNWSDASVKFVPAGERLNGNSNLKDIIEKMGENEVIHVDTGLGPLDHHQTPDDNVCGASRTWDFVREVSSFFEDKNSDKIKSKILAVSRMVKVVVDIDHFKEVFRKDPTADYHEFDLAGILEGLKIQFPNQDDYYVEFVIKALDAVLHGFENRIWAEKEIAENGQKFQTRFGEGIGFETINDSVIKLAQKMGYAIVVRKDPRKGYVRIKAVPTSEKTNIDLTLVYEKLSKMDPDATWYLHVSKKMLLNGSVKNPKMRPTKLSVDEIIKVLEKV
ncbi:MAG: DHH family phosphoesterase [Candidatus Levybacteria bacterium]|nr:DHH family phosphoesterase [Candidatus Levybacteria bacterium]